MGSQTDLECILLKLQMLLPPQRAFVRKVNVEAFEYCVMRSQMPDERVRENIYFVFVCDCGGPRERQKNAMKMRHAGRFRRGKLKSTPKTDGRGWATQTSTSLFVDGH